MFNGHRTTAGFLAATLAGAALFVSAPAVAQDVHGAIAFGTETDQSNGVAYGFAWNFPAKDTADAEAMNACITSGGTNCIQLAWFQNSCGALAMDQYGNAQGKPGMTREQAEARALQTCEAAGGAGCNIVGSLCTAPDGEPGTYSGSESVLPLQDTQTTVTGPADESPAHEEPVPLQDAQTAVTGPADESLTREERVRVQQALNALGFDAGPADGIFGPRTRAAIWEWQSASGHEATGYVTREQAASLTAVDASPEQEPRQEDANDQSGEVLFFGPETGLKCAEGESEGEPCWVEFTNKPGCFYLEYSFSAKPISWSGNCLDNVAHGRGTLTIVEFDKEVENHELTGEMVQGFLQGRWVQRYTRGPNTREPDIGAIQYVDSKAVSHTIRSPDGSVTEYQFVDGKTVSSTMRHPDGRVREDQYVDGKRVGWVTVRHPDGSVWEAPTNDGKPDWSRMREKP